jgi:hypothetical protein
VPLPRVREEEELEEEECIRNQLNLTRARLFSTRWEEGERREEEFIGSLRVSLFKKYAL